MNFPKYHLATSVTNRIMQIAQVKQRMEASPKPPMQDQTAMQSAQLDQALMTPPSAVPAPVGSEAAVATEALQGGDPATAIASIGVLDSLQ